MARRPHQSGLTLDAVRAKQVRLMAERESLTVSEWLDQIIIREWSDTGCNGLPGFKVAKAIGPDNVTPVVSMSIDSADGQVLMMKLGLDAADKLSIGLGQGCAADTKTFAGDAVTYRRKGKGFILSLIADSGISKHPLHPSVARDLSRIIALTIEAATPAAH